MYTPPPGIRAVVETRFNADYGELSVNVVNVNTPGTTSRILRKSPQYAVRCCVYAVLCVHYLNTAELDRYILAGLGLGWHAARDTNNWANSLEAVLRQGEEMTL